MIFCKVNSPLFVTSLKLFLTYFLPQEVFLIVPRFIQRWTAFPFYFNVKSYLQGTGELDGELASEGGIFCVWVRWALSWPPPLLSGPDPASSLCPTLGASWQPRFLSVLFHSPQEHIHPPQIIPPYPTPALPCLPSSEAITSFVVGNWELYLPAPPSRCSLDPPSAFQAQLSFWIRPALNVCTVYCLYFLLFFIPNIQVLKHHIHVFYLTSFKYLNFSPSLLSSLGSSVT